jgi:hypothetical protein
VVLGESSPSLDDTGRPLVDVIVGILRSACSYIDFNLSDSEDSPKSALRRESVDESSREVQPSKLSQQEADKTRVMFNPSLVGRLCTIARKLLEVVDIIQKGSSPDLAQLTEQWKIQWHVEAYMFISNRTEMRESKTFYSLVACNRSAALQVIP